MSSFANVSLVSLHVNYTISLNNSTTWIEHVQAYILILQLTWFIKQEI